jgi:hypothetical protein
MTSQWAPVSLNLSVNWMTSQWAPVSVNLSVNLGLPPGPPGDEPVGGVAHLLMEIVSCKPCHGGYGRMTPDDIW